MSAAASLAESLLPEFDNEMAGARRALERVPDDRLDWRPHAKSWTLRQLVTHIAQLPEWGTMGIELDELDLAPPGKPRVGQAVPIQSRAELLARFDEHVKVARAALAGASDDHLRGPWLLKVGGRTVSSKTRMMVMRGWVLSHLIHHRAQLGVYLRLLDVPVPMQYGPTADEGSVME